MRRPGKKALAPEQAANSSAAQTAAVALLARRDFSISELTRKLIEKGFTRDAVDAAVARLAAANALNDQRYGTNVVAYRARRGQGPARIRNELRKAGVAAELVEEAIKPEEDAPDFVKLARQARERKFGAEIPKDWKQRSKQARFLQYRGFSTDHIRAVLAGVPDDDGSGSEPSGEPDPI